MAGDKPTGAWRRKLFTRALEVIFALALVAEGLTLWLCVTRFFHLICVGVACIALGLRLRYVIPRPNEERPPKAIIAGRLCLPFVGVLCLMGVAGTAWEHGVSEHSALESVYLGTSARGRVLRLFNVVPEVDMSVSSVKLSRTFKLWPAEQLDGLEDALRAEYRRMADDGDFKNVGNVVTNAVAPGANRHFYRYTPAGRHGTGPLFVFLHGAGGNLVLYTWGLKQFADHKAATLVCPTYGGGEWNRPEATELVVEAIQDTLAKDDTIAPDRVYLVGHSQGAATMWRVIEAHPDLFAGAVCMSGYGSPRALPEGREFPVLFLLGERDIVDADMARSAADHARTAGATPTVGVIQGAGHFFMLTDPLHTDHALSEWLDGIPRLTTDN